MIFLKKEKLKGKNWKIYVDESYSVTNDFLVGAIAVDKDKEDKIKQRYRKKILKNHQEEIKSVDVSDSLNGKALKVLSNFRNFNQIVRIKKDRALSQQKGESEASLIFQQTFWLFSYVHSLIYLIKRINEKYPLESLEIIYDHRNDLEEENIFNRYLPMVLQDIKRRLKSNLKISYCFADSKNELGLQWADMLVGAYRKNIKYSLIEKENIIPIKFQLVHWNNNFFENGSLMQLYGKLMYSESYLQDNNFKNKIDQVLILLEKAAKTEKFFNRLITYSKEFEKLDPKLLPIPTKHETKEQKDKLESIFVINLEQIKKDAGSLRPHDENEALMLTKRLIKNLK